MMLRYWAAAVALASRQTADGWRDQEERPPAARAAAHRARRWAAASVILVAASLLAGDIAPGLGSLLLVPAALAAGLAMHEAGRARGYSMGWHTAVVSWTLRGEGQPIVFVALPTLTEWQPTTYAAYGPFPDPGDVAEVLVGLERLGVDAEDPDVFIGVTTLRPPPPELTTWTPQ